MTALRSSADLIVRAPGGDLIAAVEVKNRIGFTPEIAAEFRRNIMAHSDLGVAPCFLLLSQDQGYAWHQHPNANNLLPPDATFTMSSVVERYTGEQEGSTRLRGFQLELIVYLWLLDLADGVTADDDAALTLTKIGFINAIQSAIFDLEPVLDSVRRIDFLLEIALEQEQEAAATLILDLAEQGAIALVIPSFALSEPFSNLTYRRVRRVERIEEMRHQELRQLRRSASRRRIADRLESLLIEMSALAAEQIEALEAVVTRVLTAGRTIEMTRDVFLSALAIEQRYGLSLQDSVMLASVFTDLAMRPIDEPKCFVSSNYKDYDDPDIRRRLRAAGCRYIGSFGAAQDYLRSVLRGAANQEPLDE